jgi:hypothetical protein
VMTATLPSNSIMAVFFLYFLLRRWRSIVTLQWHRPTIRQTVPLRRASVTPRQQFLNAIDLVLRDAVKNIGEPSLQPRKKVNDGGGKRWHCAEDEDISAGWQRSKW